jgi:hypothetical protein
MKAKQLVLGGILVLGILGAPTLGAESREASPRPEASTASSQKTVAMSRAELRRERNKKFMSGMNTLPRKIEALLKKSPDFSGS